MEEVSKRENLTGRPLCPGSLHRPASITPLAQTGNGGRSNLQHTCRQGIRFLAKFHDVMIFGRKINYDMTTCTLSQQPMSCHNFFRPVLPGNVMSYFFRQQQARCHVIIFGQWSCHDFWQHSAYARNAIMEKQLPEFGGRPAHQMSCHDFFSVGPAGQCHVIILFRPGWTGNVMS